MDERVKKVAREDLQRVQALAGQAVRSGAFVYPIKGVLYYISHRSLWQPFLSKLVPIITTTVGVTTFMFFFAYLPQAAVLAIFNGPLAALSTFFLVLSESSTITNLISRTMFLDEVLIDTFDGTLVSRGSESIVAEGRQLRNSSDPVGKLGKIIRKPFERFTPTAIIRYFMYLPLNFIPVVGTVLFIILQGKRFGPNAHARYFQLKQMSTKQRDDFVEKRRGAYTSFGIVSVLLEMIPFAGIFFQFTNNVGAALWAADEERNTNTAPTLRDQAKKVE